MGSAWTCVFVVLVLPCATAQTLVPARESVAAHSEMREQTAFVEGPPSDTKALLHTEEKGMVAEEEMSAKEQERDLAVVFADDGKGQPEKPEGPEESVAGAWVELDVIRTGQNLQSMLAAFADTVSVFTGGKTVIPPESYNKETLDGMKQAALDHINKNAQPEGDEPELIALHTQVVQGVNFGLTLLLDSTEASPTCWFARYTGLLLDKKDGLTWKVTGACRLSTCHKGLPIAGEDTDCFVEEPNADDLGEDSSGMPKVDDDQEDEAQTEDQDLELLETRTTLRARTGNIRPDGLLEGCPVTFDQFCNYVFWSRPVPDADMCLPERHLFWDAYPECKLPIRQQGNCGSCWAFANTRMIGERFCRKTGGKVKIWPSVRQVINCRTNGGQCDGGNAIDPARHDLVAESQWPYSWFRSLFFSSNCKPDEPDWKYETIVRIGATSYLRLGQLGTLDQVKRDIICRGPLYGGSANFDWYRNGQSQTTQIERALGWLAEQVLQGVTRHAVTLEGWDDSEDHGNPKGFLIANSWGDRGNPGGDAVILPYNIVEDVLQVHPLTSTGGYLDYNITAVEVVEGHKVRVTWEAPNGKHSREDTVGLYLEDSYEPVAVKRVGTYDETGVVELEIPDNNEYVLRMGLKGTKDIVHTCERPVQAQENAA